MEIKERTKYVDLLMETAPDTFTENDWWLKRGHNRLIVMPMAQPYARPRRPWTGPYLVSKVEALRTIGFSGRPQCTSTLLGFNSSYCGPVTITEKVNRDTSCDTAGAAGAAGAAKVNTYACGCWNIVIHKAFYLHYQLQMCIFLSVP